MKPKILVAIANHGTKNRHFLDRLLAEYRAMRDYDVDIVVLSNIPKDLGDDVEVRVGAPIEDPWSLPFGYKQLFADRIGNYDFFIYSEDDTLISERHINAFVEETDNLPEDRIAGFLRYEVSPDGKRYFSSMHSHYHWDPKSVVRYGGALYAYYTNEHSACFILTRNQLERAISSGGFMLPARKGRYDMLVTAATDPYTECGMKKMICISRLEEFCLHHLPNVYCGRLGLDFDLGMLEIEKLVSYADAVPEESLFKAYPLWDGDRWNKNYYESERKDVLDMVPRGARNVLSIGCGCGTTESVLVSQGIDVVGIPLNPVVSEVAASKGVSVLSPNFDCLTNELKGRQFDCIIIMDILQQIPDPVAILRKCKGLLNDRGTVVVSIPNWNHHGIIKLRWSSTGRERLGGRYSATQGGVHPTTRKLVSRWLKQAGLSHFENASLAGTRWERISRFTFGLADEIVCRSIVVSAKV